MQTSKRGTQKTKPKLTRHTTAAQKRKRAAVRTAIRQQRAPHKRVLLSPISILVLLCVGVLLCGLTIKVFASTTISSVIQAPSLRAAATIASPSHNSTTQSAAVQVQGTCPDNSYVKLQLNGAFGGVAWCGPDNSYNIPASLYPGANEVLIQAYNVTDAPGPVTPSIKVTYQPLAVAQGGAQLGASTVQSSASPSALGSPSRSASVAPTNPILLTSNFSFQSFSTQEDYSWKLDLEGGSPPYDVLVDWGDGTTSKLYFPTDPVFALNHHYQRPGYYAVRVTSTDTTGQAKIMQLAAFVKDVNGNAPFLAPTSKADKSITSQAAAASGLAKHLLVVAWPFYLIVVLMVISFWLGEVREYQAALRLGRGKSHSKARPRTA